jgi:E3 ubiquitin-protein ligase RNF14
MASLLSTTTTTTSTTITEEDQEEQNDELEALQSIYPDLINVLSNANPIIFEVAIQVDVGGNRSLPVFLGTVPTGVQVQHLSPILLRVQYCPGYPSEKPPHINLNSSWLDITTMTALQEKLSILWNDEYNCSPVVYGYIDCLSSSQTYIDTVQRIIVSEETSVLKLVHYDQLKVHEIFQTTIHDCPVCYSDVLGNECVQLDCRHYICNACFRDFIEHHISQGSVEHLTCFTPQCLYQVMSSDVLRGTDKSTQEQYDRIQLQKTLDSMTDLVYCPIKNCATPTITENDNLGQCPKCKHCFCTLCYGGWHPGTSCMDPETKLKLMKLKFNQDGTIKNNKELQQQRMNEVHEQLSLSKINKSSKRCPSCGAAVNKTAGCNKMKCLCGHAFCYSCGIDITEQFDLYGNKIEGTGYDHFYGDTSNCDLFDQQALRDWNRQNGGGGGNGHNVNFNRNMQRGRYGNVGFDQNAITKCPRCKQQNTRKSDKNNYIHCWACNTKYCHNCRCLVLNYAQHYAKGKKCPTHGEKKTSRKKEGGGGGGGSSSNSNKKGGKQNGGGSGGGGGGKKKDGGKEGGR